MAAPLSLQPHTKPPLSSRLHQISSSKTLQPPPPSHLAQINPHPCIISLEKCSSMSELKQIHAQMLRTGDSAGCFRAIGSSEHRSMPTFISRKLRLPLGTAIIDMYAKCGNVGTAVQILHEMPEKVVMTWTGLIVGLAMCGKGEKGLEYLHEMERKGVKPDAITFVGVLAACSHAGLADEGTTHFNSMASRYGIRPSIEHNGGLVDKGWIAKPEELIQRMPMKPDHFVLGGLLGACRIHGNLEAAERAAKQLLEIDPENGGTYVLLSNIYKPLKKWKEAKRIKELMAERGIKKPRGCSSVEVNGAVHEFEVIHCTHNP